ncbi:MAG: ABC transporter ATP-binding protein [Bacteroidota bacterium]
MVGISMIFPFLQVVSDPKEAMSHPTMGPWFEFVGLQRVKTVVIGMGLVVFLALTCSNLVRAFVGWWQQRLAYRISHDLTIRLLEIYLARPYQFYLQNNTSKFQVKILSEVNKFVTGVLIPMIDFSARAFLILMIVILLLFVDPLLSVATALGLGSMYFIVYMLLRKRLKILGEKRIEAGFMRFRSLKEVFSAVKTHRIYQSELYFHNRFREYSLTLSKIQPELHLYTKTPRLFIELVTFGSIILITIILYFRSGSIKEILPVLGLYALAGVRLLPALQQAYSALTQVRNNKPTLEVIFSDLVVKNVRQRSRKSTLEPLNFERDIEMKNVYFKYDSSDEDVIKGIDLRIVKGQTIAFVGSTGSGKTTLVDLIVGLLSPTSGKITVDDQEINEKNTENWLKNIAYVPQDVVLFDDTVEANIAIGQEEADRDFQRIQQASKTAQIHEFLANELPQGYQTKVGERGTRLSGGEKQRVGLARAFYRRPSILILDEATSALDNVTESKFMESMRLQHQDLTTIMIAHRLSTVKEADCIYLLNKGEIIARGSYQTLLQENDSFQALASTR